MNYYQRRKQREREFAIEYTWKIFNGEISYWSELVEYGEYFRYVGKRYGLIREFRENGII